MKITFYVLVLMMLLHICQGCTRPITGKIVDAETGQPIEGAILLVEWTKVHGFGNSYTSSEKAVEVLSNKNGVVNIPGYNDPTVQSPDVTVYKPGYVAWNNKWIFPDRRKRTDFEWGDGYVFKLDKFREEYSYVAHEDFVSSCINIGQQNPNKKQFWDIYSQNESDKSLKEFRDWKEREKK